MEFTANNIYSININYTLIPENSSEYSRLEFKPTLILKYINIKTKCKLVYIYKFVNNIENICQEL